MAGSGVTAVPSVHVGPLWVLNQNFSCRKNLLVSVVLYPFLPSKERGSGKLTPCPRVWVSPGGASVPTCSGC